MTNQFDYKSFFENTALKAVVDQGNIVMVVCWWDDTPPREIINNVCHPSNMYLGRWFDQFFGTRNVRPCLESVGPDGNIYICHVSKNAWLRAGYQLPTINPYFGANHG